MSEEIKINNVNGVDIVQYQPKGVCCKLMQMRIKDNIIQDVEFVGGCNGNLSGIGILIKGMNINDIAGSRTVKEVLDNLCLIKEINNTTYDKYEVSDEEDSDNYHDLEKPDVSNTKYYACVVDKNRAGAKPKLAFRLNLDYNRWEEVGYLRLKQQ